MKLFQTAVARFLILLAFILGAHSAYAKDGSSFTPPQQKDIEKIVHDYLLQHPEVLIQSLSEYQERQTRDQQSQAGKALAEQKKKIFEDPTSVVVGNPRGDVTLVEFFDYQCGYCKRSFPELLKLMADDKNVRVILKEYPILGPESIVASKVALASVAQGKYFEFHKALMNHKGGLDDESIFAIASDVGLDVKRLKADMNSPRFSKIIADNHALGDALALTGTPAFIIGNTLVGGAISEAEMLDVVKKTREARK
jgi:protein-disulfide isomerase